MKIICTKRSVALILTPTFQTCEPPPVGIVDVKPYSWSPKDIDFIEGGRETARRICIGLGVPPMLIGIPGDNTYSNYKEARAAFWGTATACCASPSSGNQTRCAFDG